MDTLSLAVRITSAAASATLIYYILRMRADRFLSTLLLWQLLEFTFQVTMILRNWYTIPLPLPHNDISSTLRLMGSTSLIFIIGSFPRRKNGKDKLG